MACLSAAHRAYDSACSVVPLVGVYSATTAGTGVTDHSTAAGVDASRTRPAPLTCSAMRCIYGADFQRRVERLAFARSSSHLVLAGSIPSPSASSARFAANASISSSCSTNATSDACFARTLRTTTLRGLTGVSVTTARAGAQYDPSHPGISSLSPRSAGFITGISARRDRPRSRPARLPPRSSAPTALSCVDTVIRRCRRCRRPCRFRRGRSRSLYETLPLPGSPFRPGQGAIAASRRRDPTKPITLGPVTRAGKVAKRVGPGYGEVQQARFRPRRLVMTRCALALQRTNAGPLHGSPKPTAVL